MNRNNQTVTGLPSRIQDAVDNHAIVLVVSPVTDTGPVIRWLEAMGREYHRVQLGMGSADSRTAFRELQRSMGWSTLPQIFVRGGFVGGICEFTEFIRNSETVEESAKSRAWARWLGYAGLAPFLLLALSSNFAGEELASWSVHALLVYGALILSFVGALYWARGIGGAIAQADARLLPLSVLPALTGWIALLLPAASGSLLMVAAFLLLYLLDRREWGDWPWFLSLRAHLTAGAVISLLVMWAVLVFPSQTSDAGAGTGEASVDPSWSQPGGLLCPGGEAACQSDGVVVPKGRVIWRM